MLKNLSPNEVSIELDRIFNNKVLTREELHIIDLAVNTIQKLGSENIMLRHENRNLMRGKTNE
jgi:hypothetical protein